MDSPETFVRLRLLRSPNYDTTVVDKHCLPPSLDLELCFSV